MELIKNVFLISADKDLNSKVKIGGKSLFVDRDFDKYRYSTQIGEVFSCPKKIDEKEFINDTAINNGDIVIFHHFVCQPNNLVIVGGKELYKCEFYNLWAKIENQKITPIEDFIFVEPILEPESNLTSNGLLLKTSREPLKNQGIIFALSSAARKSGLRMGDKVFFTNNADYDIKILESTLYRMRVRNIIGVERNGQLVCLSDKLLVKEIVKENKLNGLIYFQNKREKTGVVKSIGEKIKGISVGTNVSYFEGLSSSLNYNGENYSFLSVEQLNYKYI